MNKTLYWYNIKNNIKLFIIFVLIMFMYKGVTISMFNPDSSEEMDALLELIPEALLRAMGYHSLDPSLAGFLSGYFYGFLITMFPLILTIILSYSLTAKLIDNGSMSNLLATPNTRQSIILTQILSQLTILTVLFFTITLFGWLVSAITFPGHLALGTYMLLNLGALLLFFAIGGITFFFGTLFNDGSKALSFAIGAPLGFFLINMFRGFDESLEFLRFFTILTLYDNDVILQGDTIILFQFSALFIIGLCCYTLSIHVFKEKDLTL